jgi:tight adherence protein B
VRRVVLALLVAALLAPAAALAAEVKSTDTSGYPTVRLTVVGDAATSAPPSVWENDSPVNGVHTLNLGESKSVVLAVDRSRSMAGQAMSDAVAAARSFVQAKPAADRIAVEAFGSGTLALTDFSTSTIDADTALNSLSVDDTSGTALNDVVVQASGLLAAETMPARILILLTDGADSGSQADLTTAIQAAQDAGVRIYAIGIEGAGFNAASLRTLADETGGSYYSAATTDVLAEIYSSIADEFGRTWEIEYATRARAGAELDVRVQLENGETTTATVTVPGSAATPSTTKDSPLLPEFFYSSDWGPLVFAGVVGLLVLLAAVLAFSAPRGAWLKGRLEPHVAAQRRQVLKQQRQRERMPFLRGLFTATESTFANLGPFRRIEQTLERGDLPLKAGEFVWLLAGSGFFFALLHAVFFKAAWSVALGFAEGAAIPYAFITYKARKRTKAFENQLPDMLVTMAASLKAGHSFRQGVQSVVDEGVDPASKEFKRVLTETQLGRPMDDAMGEMAERLGSKNFQFVMSAVSIQRQVGGSLATLFDMVADTVRQRHQFQRKIKGLTAMGRMSAYVLVGLPFFVFFAITLINHTYMEPLLTSSTGHKLIAAGATMMLIGSLLLKKIVSFKG